MLFKTLLSLGLAGTLPMASSQFLGGVSTLQNSGPDSFQCGDGNFTFALPSPDARACPCSLDTFTEFVNLGCPIPASTIQDDGSIYLAGILDLTSYWWAPDIFAFTVDGYNRGVFKDVNGVPLNNRRLQYQLADSACDEMEAVRAYWQLRTENDNVPPDGVIGTRCSGASLSLARLTSVEQVPQVSPASSSAKLSDNDLPEFSRLVAPQDERGEAAAMVALLRSFKWEEIAILSTDKSFSIDWETNLRKLWIGPHSDASGQWNGEVVYNDNFRLDESGQDVDPESIEQVLQNFPKERIRVIVLLAHNTDAYPILKRAMEMNFQPDTVWVGPASWVGRDDLDDDLSWLPTNKAPGYLGLTPLRNHNQYGESFKNGFDNFLIARGQEPWESLPVYAAETVDSIVLLAHAIDKARDQPGGGDVTAVLRQIVYEPGVSGRVEFTSLGDRKDPVFTVLNMGKDGKWNEVGTAATGEAAADVQLSQICWAEYGCGLEEAPADAYPEPRVKLPIWTVAIIVVICLLLLVLTIKYWRSRSSKNRMRVELEKLQQSVVGMRAAKMTYIPKHILENDDLRRSIESSGAPRVTSLIMSASVQSSGSVTGKPQWCWQETDFRMDTHDDAEIFGDRSSCWIKYDDQYNDFLEKTYQQQNCTGTVSMDLAGSTYVVNFDLMTQTKNSTGFVRKVIRHEEKDSSTKGSITTSDTDSIGAQFGSDLPREIRSEPQMVLVEGDIIQISKQRDDGWAFGTKLYHADEDIVREFVKLATIKDDMERGLDSNASEDTGWFPMDFATRPPSAKDLEGLQATLSDTGELEAPPHWDKIVDKLVVQRSSLDSSDPEYLKVKSAFLSTLKARKTKIIAIERVQNLGMWQSYVVKRQTMCYRETGVDNKEVLRRYERSWLWHGTNKEVYEKIIQQGFNRSFCGKNATLWGKGVYFARDGEYSSREVYSVPDSKKVQCILACRVMVGEYCKGKKDALTPDVRDPKTHSLYDSTVDNVNNPGIYVTYNDAQAYPEYIIRFKFLD